MIYLLFYKVNQSYIVRLLGDGPRYVTDGNLGPDLVQFLQIVILPENLDGLVKHSDDPASMRPKAGVSLNK